MSLPVETDTVSAILTATETEYCALTANHATCEVVVNPNGQAAAIGSTWNLYDRAANGVEVLIASGQIALAGAPTRILFGRGPKSSQPSSVQPVVPSLDPVVQAGGVFVLKGKSGNGASSAAVVTASLKGFSDVGVIVAPEEVDGHTALLATETTFATLTAAHQCGEVLIDAKGDLNARDSVWRIYSVDGAVVTKLFEGVLSNPSVKTRIFSQVQASGLLRITGQAKTAATAVPIDVALIGYDPSTPAASGGGITQLTADVLAGPGSGSLAATVVNITGAAGVLGNIRAKTWNWQPAATAAYGTNWQTFDLGTVDDTAAGFAVAQSFRFYAETVTSTTPSGSLKYGGGYQYYLGLGVDAAGAPYYGSQGFEIYNGRASTTRAWYVQGLTSGSAVDPAMVMGFGSINSVFSWGATNGTGQMNVGARDTARALLVANDAAVASDKPILGVGAAPGYEVILGDDPEAPGTKAHLTVYAPYGVRTKFAAAGTNDGYQFGNAAGASNARVGSTDGTNVYLAVNGTERLRVEDDGAGTTGTSILGGAGDYGDGADIVYFKDGTATSIAIGGGFGMWSDSKRPAFAFGAGADRLIIDSVQAGDVTGDAKTKYLKVILTDGLQYGIQCYAIGG